MPAPGGDSADLQPALYHELRAIARRLIAAERDGHTLSPTALLHEAYLRLADGALPPDASHLRALTARVMRHVLVDHALARRANKRGGPEQGPALTLSSLDELTVAPAAAAPSDLLAVHQALEQLSREDARAASVVELRCFGGLNLEDIAQALGVSLATVKRDWLFGKTRLAGLLKD
ncbi:MAG: RNA polymerase subunit sigma-70 [Roseateles depolymerans]|uniref:RNA polymerase subunit sigma-70 n=1 Tax=Roseateles depolymerans TaxID=76731 RepID=A0A2W5DWS4_9BURK|nr:MAG: RNA polymerase subunit sigma-70 [Roseateles depolymerans]